MMEKLMALWKIRIRGVLSYELRIAVFSIGVAGVILLLLKLVFGAEISITSVLLLALVLLIPRLFSMNKDVLDQILHMQKENSKAYWDYRVYLVDENPANASSMIRISNANDVYELTKIGYENLHPVEGAFHAFGLEEGMSMLSRIGWELMRVQRIGEFKYYYIFRRASDESFVVR